MNYKFWTLLVCGIMGIITSYLPDSYMIQNFRIQDLPEDQQGLACLICTRAAAVVGVIIGAIAITQIKNENE